MIVLVCGGRDYNDQERIERELNAFDSERPIDLLIEGGATGADYHARRWAQDQGIHVATVQALWKHYGKSAGPKRNLAMLQLDPTYVIAFPGGNGTKNMVQQARACGILVREIAP